MFDFEEALRLVSKQTVLCVGDVMLDDFVYGEVTRISPEAPTPVLAVKHNTIEIGGAGNVARNIAALGATCIFVGLVGDDEAGLTLRKALAKLGAVVPELVIDKDAADDAQSALRLRASFHPPDARRLGNNGAGERREPSGHDRACGSGDAEGRRSRTLRLCQRRADRAGDPRHHRGGAPARQAGDRRSEGPRLSRLSRRDHDHAERQGTCRRGASAAPQRGGDRRRRRRACEDGRERSRAGHAQRTGHEPACRRAGADPHRSLSGQGARCVRCRRYGGGGDGGAGGDAHALRIRHARSQRGRRRGGRQARHFDGFAW